MFASNDVLAIGFASMLNNSSSKFNAAREKEEKVNGEEEERNDDRVSMDHMKEDNTKKDDEREASSIASDHLVCSLEFSSTEDGEVLVIDSVGETDPYIEGSPRFSDYCGRPSVRFNKMMDKIRLKNEIDMSGAWTISVWVDTTRLCPGRKWQSIACSRYGDSSFVQFEDGQLGSWDITLDRGGAMRHSGVMIGDLEPGWRHLVTVAKDFRVQLFVDGMRCGKPFAKLDPMFQLAVVGNGTFGDGVSGTLANFQVFNAALTEDQVEALFFEHQPALVVTFEVMSIDVDGEVTMVFYAISGAEVATLSVDLASSISTMWAELALKAGVPTHQVRIVSDGRVVVLAAFRAKATVKELLSPSTSKILSNDSR